MDKRRMFKYCFGCSPDIFPETVIVTPVIPAKKFTEYTETRDFFKGRLYSGMIAFAGGVDFGVINCGIGESLSGDAILLLESTSVKKIIFTGSCGGLNDCGIGNLIVCENAFNGGGFVKYHTDGFEVGEAIDAGDIISSDQTFSKCLKTFLTERIRDKTALRSGNIFTIGSLMAEWSGNLLSIEKKGFKGIDMELSAIYHAARKVHCKATGLVFVSDLPREKPLWKELDPKEKKAYDNGIQELVRLSVEFTVDSVQ